MKIKKYALLGLSSALAFTSIFALASCGDNRKNVDFKDYKNEVTEDKYDAVDDIIDDINIENKSFIYEYYTYFKSNEVKNDVDYYNNISEYELLEYDYNNDICSVIFEEHSDQYTNSTEGKADYKIKNQIQKDEDNNNNKYYAFDLNTKYYQETSESVSSYMRISDFDDFIPSKFDKFDEDKHFIDDNVYTVTFKAKNNSNSKITYNNLDGKIQFYKDGNTYYYAYYLTFVESTVVNNVLNEETFLYEGFAKLDICDVSIKRLSKDNYTLGSIDYYSYI